MLNIRTHWNLLICQCAKSSHKRKYTIHNVFNIKKIPFVISLLTQYQTSLAITPPIREEKDDIKTLTRYKKKLDTEVVPAKKEVYKGETNSQ